MPTTLDIAAANILQLFESSTWQLANNGLQHANIEAIECSCSVTVVPFMW